MSNRDKNMFRQEQRFSFRKYSFGLASALIANVVFGATIAGGPVVHANTETEAATVTSTSSVQSETVGSTEPSVAEETVATPEERSVSLTYTVKVVDTEGAVLKTEVRTVDVTTSDEVASAFAELGEDLVPTDYKLIAGLGQVLVYENQDNAFTVTVEKVVTEPVVETVSETSKLEASATVESSEVTNVSSETVSKASSEAEKNLNSVTETVPNSEAPVEDSAMSETMVAPAPIKVTEAVTKNTNSLSALALLAYEVRYTDSEGQVVGKTAGLVTAESKDGVATKEVSFSANDIPSGYELAVGQSSVLTKQLVENQINILSFAVVKKSEEEEIAESQLANKEVLEQVVSEADLLADEALRQVAKVQAGNTSLEAAAQETKEVAKEAQAILNDASATQEVVDTTVETVKASTLALADEMLKVDGDGMLTAQLAVSSTNSATVSTNATYNVSYFEDMNSRVPDYVRVSNISVNGQTITYEFIVNEINSTGYGKAYHEFALGNEVDTTSVTIVRQQRSDANSAWVNDGSWNAGTWVGGDRQYFSRSNGNILGALYPYNNARDNTTGAEVDAANINDQVGTLYREQMPITTRAYKYTITATARDGKNPANMAFMAGFRAGTDNRAYYVATPGVTDPVDQPTQASDKQEIFVFQDTPIKTVNAGTAVPNNTDKVKIGTITDADVIQSITVTDGDSLGYSVDTDGNAYGTPNGPNGLDSYKRALNVTDKKGNTTEVFSRASGSDDRYVTYILSATADSNAIVFNNGQSADARKQAVLDKVVVSSGTASSVVEAGDKKYKKYIVDPATGQEVPLPTAAGDHTVTVRVVTASNVYKDVPVTITNPTNRPPVVTPITDETNVNVDGEKSQAIYVFGINQGSTEDSNGATGTSPVADKNKATRKVAEISDPDGTISTIQYHDLRNTVPDLASGQGSTPALTVSKDGYLEGKLIYGPGAKSTRRLDVTDNGGAKTESTSFKILGYTDKLANTTAIEKAFGARPTTQEIFSKLTIDVNSSYPNAYPADLEIPADQYTREVVGYRTITTSNGTETKGDLTTATADTLPTSGSYEVKVKTKNVYGQEIFNWVRVNHAENTPTTATDNTTPTYGEKTVVPGTPATSTPVFTDASGQPITAPSGATYEIPADFQTPEGYTAEIDPNTGVVTVTATDGTSVESIEVPVKVTYSDNSTDTTTAVFKLDTDGDNQPDVTDTDDDNDGIPDGQDTNSKTATKTTVSVDDATVVAGKEITPIPVTVTTDDTKATVEVTDLPAGLTYNPTTKQIEGTPTGAEIPEGQDSTTVTVTATVTDATGTPVSDTAIITIQRDTDGDGIPDVTDTDDDSDGIPDGQDANSKTATKTTVSVDDATVVAGKEITPIPVTVTTDDTQATVEVTNLPAGLTYNPTTKQIEGTPTGAEIPEGQDSTTVTVTATVTDATGTPVSDTAVITIQRDTDGDGIPDVTDTDDDNDGIPDGQDTNSKTATKTTVSVDDATVVAGKEITPIPVTVTTDDTKATVEVTDLPAGLTYNPTTKQIEGTPTGAEIPEGQDSTTVTVTATVTDATGTPVSDTAVITIQRDTDGDGQPDVTDTDDDNDGIPDTQDNNPKTPATSTVTVDDATVVAGQPIPAIPVTVTTDDTQATVAVKDLPAGLTYNPTTKQIEGTPTGAEIPEGQDSTTVTVTATVTDVTGTPVSDTAVITIQRDTDGDGQPDVTDTDDDNDGIPDGQDANPKDANTSAVTVDDATVVSGQPITPIPVTVTTDDTQATVEVTGLPAGLTYNPTTKQIEGTPTGAEIPAGQDSVPVTVTATVTDATGTPVTDTAVITIQRDTDGDGQPDVTDPDDDNDGIPDGQDENSKVANTSAVTVDDATVVSGQPITPIPVTVTTDDTQATVEVTGLPAGLTYNPTTKQIEGTPTGAEIPEGQDSVPVTVTATVTDATGTSVTDTAVITIQRDTDGDGKPDVTDTDDDNDGIPDEQDNNPKTAKETTVTADGSTVVAGKEITPIPVTVDSDAKNPTVEVTGLPEGLSYNPATNQIEGTPSGKELPEGQDTVDVPATITVTDGSGNPVTKDITITVQRDTDGDGTPDVTDKDDDGDGIPDDVEKQNGTDPKTPNTDTTVTPATVVEGQPVPDTTVVTPESPNTVITPSAPVNGISVDENGKLTG
ncbi:thrombospondin type 3 repeat-containing protein, partial [Streptococcus suis]